MRPQPGSRCATGPEAALTSRPSSRPVQLWDPALSALEDVHNPQRDRLAYSSSSIRNMELGFTNFGTVATQFYRYIWIWVRLPWRRQL